MKNKKVTKTEKIKQKLTIVEWTKFLIQNFPTKKIIIVDSIFNDYVKIPKRMKYKSLNKKIENDIKKYNNIDEVNLKTTISIAVITREKVLHPNSIIQITIEFIKEYIRPVIFDETFLNKIIEYVDNIEMLIKKENDERIIELIRTIIIE